MYYNPLKLQNKSPKKSISQSHKGLKKSEFYRDISQLQRQTTATEIQVFQLFIKKQTLQLTESEILRQENQRLQYAIEQLSNNREQNFELLYKIRENENRMLAEYAILQKENEQLRKNQHYHYQDQINELTHQYNEQNNLYIISSSNQHFQQVLTDHKLLQQKFDIISQENIKYHDELKQSQSTIDNLTSQITIMQQLRHTEINSLIQSREQSLKNISQLNLKDQDQLLNAYNKLELQNQELQREITKLKNEAQLHSSQIEQINYQFKECKSILDQKERQLKNINIEQTNSISKVIMPSKLLDFIAVQEQVELLSQKNYQQEQCINMQKQENENLVQQIVFLEQQKQRELAMKDQQYQNLLLKYPSRSDQSYYMVNGTRNSPSKILKTTN